MSKTKASAITRFTNSPLVVRKAGDAVNAAFATLAEVIATTDNPGALTSIYTLLTKEWSKVIDDQKGVIRSMLLTLLDDEGAADGLNRHATAEFEGEKFSIKKQVSRSSKPDDVKFMALLRNKDIPIREAYSEVIVQEMDAGKVARLVSAGSITEAEYDECRKITATALKVEKV